MGLSRSWVSGITVEPCMFFFSLCNGMFVIIAQNLYIAKADMLAVFGSCYCGFLYTLKLIFWCLSTKLSPQFTNCLWRQRGGDVYLSINFWALYCQTSLTCLPRCARWTWATTRPSATTSPCTRITRRRCRNMSQNSKHTMEFFR